MILKQGVATKCAFAHIVYSLLVIIILITFALTFGFIVGPSGGVMHFTGYVYVYIPFNIYLILRCLGFYVP